MGTADGIKDEFDLEINVGVVSIEYTDGFENSWYGFPVNIIGGAYFEFEEGLQVETIGVKGDTSIKKSAQYFRTREWCGLENEYSSWYSAIFGLLTIGTTGTLTSLYGKYDEWSAAREKAHTEKLEAQERMSKLNAIEEELKEAEEELASMHTDVAVNMLSVFNMKIATKETLLQNKATLTRAITTSIEECESSIEDAADVQSAIGSKIRSFEAASQVVALETFE